MKNLLIVLAVTTVSFLAGGGWKFFFSEVMYGLWHNVHSDWEYMCTYFTMFTGFGIAQAMSGLLWSVVTIRLWPVRYRYWWVWAFLVASLAFGGYQFFLFPSEYVFSGTPKVALLYWLPAAFVTKGGAAGLAAAVITALVQKVKQRRKPSPNQAP